MKLGRNDPCDCGSGKKYKKCCLLKGGAVPLADEVRSPVDLDQLRREFEALPLTDKAGRVGLSTAEFVKFSDIYVKPRLIEKQNLEELNAALRATFLRMHLQMQSLSLLVAAPHYQAAMMICRNIFELSLDLLVLAAHPDMLPKYLAFPEVERFNYASRLLHFLEENPQLDRTGDPNAISWATDPQRRANVEHLCAETWGVSQSGRPIKPNGWSNLSVADLAALAGADSKELYRRIYAPSSWYVHGGSAGHLDLAADAYCTLHIVAHSNAQKVFQRSLQKVDEIFGISRDYPEFAEHLDRMMNPSAYL